MGQMRMGSAVSGTLGKGQVLLIIQVVNAFGCEHADRFPAVGGHNPAP